MDEKVLVNVMLPATGKTYDFWVPTSTTIHDATIFIANILSQREHSMFQTTGESALALRDTGMILDHNTTFADHNIINGFELLLV
ncbi:MAG: hypothetical protein LBG97_00310 [Coriobacteriales bacterium]|jgi:uncharacterized ubiquitin-like protein YukD|nr:hypothetical protein [Coriobacteriales bacterium]